MERGTTRKKGQPSDSLECLLLPPNLHFLACKERITLFLKHIPNWGSIKRQSNSFQAILRGSNQSLPLYQKAEHTANFFRMESTVTAWKMLSYKSIAQNNAQVHDQLNLCADYSVPLSSVLLILSTLENHANYSIYL